jgi:hypothetical protein
MTDYDSMSAHELVLLISHDGDHCAGFQMHPCGPDNCKACEAMPEGDYDLIPQVAP